MLKLNYYNLKENNHSGIRCQICKRSYEEVKANRIY